MGRRSITSSRCCRPNLGPYRWEDYRALDGERVVENELEGLLEEGCETQSEYEMRHGEVAATRALAAAGEIAPDTDDFLPVRRNPELWELRWHFHRELRLYHGEPSAAPELLLALRYHWKMTSGTAKQIEDAQDAEIDEAGRRYDAWLDRHPIG